MTKFYIVDAYGDLLSIVESGGVPPLAQGQSLTTNAPPDGPARFVTGAWVARPPAPSSGYTWDGTSGTWIDARTLGQAQAQKVEEINAARAAIEYGTFTWSGSVFDCDLASQIRITGAVLLAQLEAAGQAFNINWTLHDNTQRTLSAPDMIAVGQALAMQVTGCHANATMLKAQIAAATTNAAVDAITWPKLD